MDTNWLVREAEFRRTALRAQESVYTIGNGYLCTRGAFEEGMLGDLPATLIHGVFDDAPIVETELANAPNWLPLTPHIGAERVQLDAGRLLRYERVLNLRQGVLSRTFRWQSSTGQTVDIRYERFISLADKNVMLIRCQITPVDFSGPMTLHAALDGTVDNAGWQHWNKVEQGQVDHQTIFLQSATRATGIILCEAARLQMAGPAEVAYKVYQLENVPTIVARFQAEQGQTVTAEKVVSLFTSHDVGRHTRTVTLAKLAEVTERGLTYNRLLEASAQAWAGYWADADVEIVGDDVAQVATRYMLFQLLITAPRNDEYVSIGAKTLSGFGYRGHVFWDTELFMLPFFTFTQPQIARNLLLYRYHTLGGARRKAREGGYKGAQYPWESAMTGDEVTPRWVPAPAGHSDGQQQVRVWTGDLELHISCNIAYAVWQYWRATSDDAFMVRYGAEMILDTAVFWGCRAEWNEKAEHYTFTNVIGPDEYHEHVDNNFFTNYLVKWHLQLALDIMAWLHDRNPAKATELSERLALTPEVCDHWRHIIDKLYIGHPANGQVFEQFEGYFARRDVNLAALEPRDRSVQSLLGIKATNETQVLKQPDVLMLLYLLPEAFDEATVRANWDYYTPRTDLTHGSSLAPGIQAILACRLGDPEWAYRCYMQAALVDLKDLRLNTEHGIHGAAAGSVWQAAVFGFGGLRLTDQGITAAPRLPAHWQRLRFKVFYHGEPHEFVFDNTPRP
ncbi:MAG TPA: glycoside hydrolase family 65 protein [Candidatus Tectomicrobia bacterium]|jgi:kojibiose phosphorylase